MFIHACNLYTHGRTLLCVTQRDGQNLEDKHTRKIIENNIFCRFLKQIQFGANFLSPVLMVLSSWHGKRDEKHLHKGRCMPCFQAERRRIESFSCTCSYCLQIKVILLSKWHILGQNIMAPFTVSHILKRKDESEC